MSTTIVETTISPTCSHLGITFACSPLEEEEEEEEEGGGGEEIIKLGVYSLPLEAWISEVKHIKEGRRSSSSGQPQRHSSQMQKRQSVKVTSNTIIILNAILNFDYVSKNNSLYHTM